MSSIRNRFYYGIKPVIPSRFRLAIRRWFAVRLRAQCANTWPIQPGSEVTQNGWSGWPDGKKFAFVLTHDVEGRRGLDNCEKLLALEKKLGFKSSFNFVPEGEYKVPRRLRDQLIADGFEVGIHDLHHDGKLFQSRKRFQEHAIKINRYIQEWEAAGFRAGFMLNQLDWLHDLNIQYDASSFDTDPFEPQPQGRKTIFPFWVAKKGSLNSNPTSDLRPLSSGAPPSALRPPISDLRPLSSDAPSSALRPPPSGYVELPYTLPQDSTLFVLFNEQNPNIWIRKLDWIAKHGGMALLNVHPDYIRFNGEPSHWKTYPVDLYESFLKHVRNRYGDAFWQPLPIQLARWYANGSIPKESAKNSVNRISSNSLKTASVEKDSKPLSGKRAAVLLYSGYPSDPRPRRAAQALRDAGAEVDFICLKESDTQAGRESVEGINIVRLPFRRRRESKANYFLQYSLFLSVCGAMLTLRAPLRRYDLVHVHNMPDFLVFGALFPKLFGARIILDLHDPMPELMMAIYHLREDHHLVQMLMRLEKASIRFADLVLTPNKAFVDRFISRGCPPDKIRIVMNSPQSEIFYPREQASAVTGKKSEKSGFRLMHHGFIAERHGLDTALRATALLKDEIPGLEFHLYGGETPYLATMQSLAEELGINEIFHYHGFKNHPEIAKAIEVNDLGLIPNSRNAFTEINLPTRIFEYLAMNKPVVVPNTTGIRDYFKDAEEAVFFNPDDPQDLANAILRVHRDPRMVAAVTARGRKVYEANRWENEKKKFINHVVELIGAPPMPSRGKIKSSAKGA